MAVDLDDVNTQGRDKGPKISDLASVIKFPERKWTTIRLFGAVTPEAGYWIKVKKKDGSFTRFYARCPSFDPATQERDSTKYDPWRDLQAKEKILIDAGKLDPKDAKVQYAPSFWMQAIVRAEQKRKPETNSKPNKKERATGFKDKDSDTWTPVQLAKLGRSLVGKVKELKGLNTVESKTTGAVKAYAVNDIRFGRDIRVFYDSKKAPADQYQVQLGEKRTPLTEEEQAYLTWDPAIISEVSFDDKTVKADFEGWASRNGVKLAPAKKSKVEDDDEDEEADEDFDEDEAPKKKAKTPAKKSSKKPVEDDDEDEDEDEEADDDFDDEEEEDDDPPPKKKGKTPAKKSSKKPVDDDFGDDEEADDEDEDEDEDEEEDDFDEDDEPTPKKKSKAPAKKSSKKPVDDDEEEDDDFDDEEDDEPAPKKKAKAPAKKSSKKPVDDEDDDFGDEDEDEDDDPPPRAKSKKAPAKKSSKKPVDDDEDEDEDEDEEPAPRRKAKPAVAKKKSRRVVDELEDDDIPF